MNLFNLVAKLTLDDEDYKKKIEEAKAKGKELADDTKNKHTASMVAGWMAVAVAVVAVTKKIADLAKATIDYADQVGDLAEKWGFTTKQIQEFDYWATQNGTTLEALLTGMRGLVNNAQAGSEAFDKLGVSVTDANGELKDQRTLFLETINALQKVENQTEKTALQFDVFGRSGVELGQVINLTSEQLDALSQKAEDYGLIISDDAIKASSDFNDELDTLQKQFRSVVADLLAGTPEAMAKVDVFVENLTQKIEDYLPKFITFAIKLVDEIAVAIIKALPSVINSLVDAIFSYDWFKLGVDMSVQIGKGLVKGISNTVQKLLGKGWLWGVGSVDLNTNNTTTALSTVTNSQISEKTTRVDESLEVRLSVESDGTIAGEKNLDVMSDLLVEKINKAMGDMIDG